MSCCPPAPNINTIEVTADEPSLGPEVERLPGESEDCYMARRGNVNETGQVDDKTEVVAAKIKNNSVFTTPSGKVGTQSSDLIFEMTSSGSGVDNWVFTPGSFAGVTITDNGSTATMAGTFDPSLHNTKQTLRVQARAGTTVIDDRTYDFSPGGGEGSDTIRLQHPLPGSIQTSGFGPRKPPASGASSQHMALDFAYAGGVTKDVMCAYDGEVVLARPGQGYGNYVMVKHVNAANQHLITTLYAHLDSIYVKVGQKVVGGQKLGKEGNTGIGSGPHLHFEVRLPNNTRVDPTPYLSGSVTVANSVTPNNQPDASAGTSTVSSDSRITPAGVKAATSCETFGPSYPTTGVPPVAPPAPIDVPPTVGDDPFEKAWYFTMTHEVNPKWMTTPPRSPSDAEVAAGLIDNTSQRQRVGWVDHPADPGGKTKFGVAQRFNASVKIEGMDYATARQTGYNKYWINSPDCSAMTSVKLAVMIFDIKYAIGPGGAQQIMAAAGVTGNESGPAETAAMQALYNARVAYYQSRSGFKTFGKGWTRRSQESLQYAQSL